MTQQDDRTRTAAAGGATAPAAGPVKEQVKDAAGQAREMAGQAVEQAQQTAGKVVEQAKAQATSRGADQKERAAGSLGAVAQAIRQTGQGLRDQEQDAAGRYADSMAQQVERFADYLRERDVSELVEDVEDLARRQPGLFLGGAVALGFFGTRFLMSSGRRAARRERALSGAPPPASAGAMTAYRPQPPLVSGGPGAYAPAGGPVGATHRAVAPGTEDA